MKTSLPLFALLLAAPAAAQQVLVVDSTGAGGAFLEVQDAIDAALDGDLVLVKDGNYATFTINAKTLRVLADSGEQPVIQGPIFVEDLAPNQSVELHGLTVDSLSAGVLVWSTTAPGRS